MTYKFFDKNSSVSAVTCADKSESEIMTNQRPLDQGDVAKISGSTQHLPEILRKQIIRKFKKRKEYLSF